MTLPMRGPAVRDATCVLLLCVVCLVLRLPGLGHIALNPDESQSEAMASYYLATSTSAFEDYPELTGVLILYKIASAIFGPYPVLPMRVLVLAICLLMTFMLYFMIRAAGSRLAGLAGGLVFLHYIAWFEGYTVNREWFAGLLLLSGAGLYVASASGAGRRRLWLLGVSGLSCSMALWFKMQSTYMVLAVPAALCLESLTAARWRRLPSGLAVYALGGAVGVGLYALGYALHGRLPAATEYIFYVLDHYATAGPETAGPQGPGYVQYFYLGQPFRPLLLVSYLGAAVALLSALRGLRDPVEPKPSERVALVFATLLLTGLCAVAMGGRFHAHYYLFIMAPVAGLCGILADAVRYPGAVQATRKGWLYLILVPLLLDRAWIVALQSPWSDWPTTAWAAAYIVVLLGLAAFALTRSRRRAAVLLVVLLWLEVAALGVHTHRDGVPQSLPYHPDRFARLNREIQARAEPGDRLYVWGWLPELYTLSRLESASRLSIAQFVVRDYGPAPFEPGIDPRYEKQLMDDLRERRPRFIVNAWRRSWTMQGSKEPWLYDLALYPDSELVAMLRSEYRKVGTFNGCDLHVRIAR